MLDNIAFLVYLFGTLLPNLKEVGGAFCITLLIATPIHIFFSSILWQDNIASIEEPKQKHLEDHRRGLTRIYCGVALILLSGIIYILAPSSKQSYGILATVGVVELSKVEEVQEISKNAYDALNNYFLSIKPKE